MKIQIKTKSDGKVVQIIVIPYSQNPLEAIMNWCVNMGYQYKEIEYEAQ